MPMYEYVCTQCEHRFESLVRGNLTPECPSCHRTALEKQPSVFSAHAGGGQSAFGAPTGGACGACGDPRGPGACSIN
jgi:putative FmdB family regulatory protein